MTIATVISSNTGEKMDSVIWNMPISMTYKCLAIIYTMNTGKEVKNHKDREVLKRQQEVFKEMQNG